VTKETSRYFSAEEVDTSIVEASESAMRMANVAAKRDDTCGLREALDALGTRDVLRIEKRAKEYFEDDFEPLEWKQANAAQIERYRTLAAEMIDDEDHG
jgi:hypothetical protein